MIKNVNITKWLDRMYLFKQDKLRDGVINVNKNWSIETNIKQILRKFKWNYYSKKRRNDRFKKDSRTDKSITTTEVVININSPDMNVIKRRIIVY